MVGATTIIATDPLPHRIEAAKAMGATLGPSHCRRAKGQSNREL
jgi:threonine dehydrogenase-like Zn-dependent dehydrogenase